MAESEELGLLRELVNWQRFQNRAALRSALEEILTTPTDRKIYELSDGTRSQPQIANQCGVSQPTVSNKWKQWRALGIVCEMPNEPGRCRHLATLESVGLKA